LPIAAAISPQPGACSPLESARADLAALSGAVGRVRIGAIQALDPFDLSGAPAAFHARHRDVALELRSGGVRALLDDLTHDRVDLTLGPVPAQLPEDVVAAPLFDDELVLATAPDHPTARAGALELAALRADPFVCLPVGTGLRSVLHRHDAAAGVTPRVPFETTSLPRLRDLVAHGLGAALVARSVAEAPGAPVAVHPVAPEPISRPVGLLHREPLGPAAAACRAFLLVR